ncbi:CARDB domain-containing protein [Hoeflea sp. AS60]|uniref:CARDB domain-containing protein n=1 Tax=Hoeflea sp. AS60 TaxID=3135780 RepID=UPI0031715591
MSQMIKCIWTIVIFMVPILVSTPESMAQSVPAHQYAALCEKLISDIPLIDCSKGTEIVVNSAGKDQFGRDLCHEPSLLPDTGCSSGSRLLRLNPVNNTPDTEIVFLCRSGSTKGVLNSVIGIHHNTRTGTTCWYHTQGHNRLSVATKLDPPATSPQQSQQAGSWAPLSQAGIAGSVCNSCHDADPYIVTPFLARTDDSNALPGFKKMEGRLDWYDRPYANFSMRRGTGGTKLPQWDANIRMKPDPQNECSRCHGFGTSFYVEDYLSFSVGQKVALFAPDEKIWMPATEPSFTVRSGKFFTLPKTHRDAVGEIENCFKDMAMLDIRTWIAGGASSRPADVAASFKRCGWHYSSIELAAASINGASWQNNSLRGSYKVRNDNRFVARDVKLMVSVDDTATPARQFFRETQTGTLAANSVFTGQFQTKGVMPDQDSIVLKLDVDVMPDPDLSDGEFLEANEDDNHAKLVLQLNDLAVQSPASATQLLPGTPIRLAFTVRNEGPLPVLGARTSVSVTNAGSTSLNCVSAHWNKLKPDLGAGEARTLVVSLYNHCAVQNRTIQIRVEVDPDGHIPERTSSNNVAVYAYTMPYPPAPPPRPGGPADLYPVVNVLTQLIRTRAVFTDMCKYMRVTPDSNICTGLELLPKVRNPEDIVVPRPMPVPSPVLEQMLEAVRALGKVDSPQHSMAMERLEQALGGEPVDLAPVAMLFSMLANEAAADIFEPGTLEQPDDAQVTVAPGWSWSAEAAGSYVSLRPSDLLLNDFGVPIGSVPFMWINGIQDRPSASINVNIPVEEVTTRPQAIGMVDGLLMPLESEWDAEYGRVSLRVSSSVSGLGFVQAYR